MIIYDEQGLQSLVQSYGVAQNVIDDIVRDCKNQTERIPNPQQYYFYNNQLYANHVTQADYCILYPIFSVPVNDLLQINLNKYLQSNVNQLCSMIASTQRYVLLNEAQQLDASQFMQYMTSVSQLIQQHPENPRQLCFDDIQIIDQQLDMSGVPICSFSEQLEIIILLNSIYTITSLNISSTYLTYTDLEALLQHCKNVRTIYCQNIILDDISKFLSLKNKYELIYRLQITDDDDVIQPYLCIDDLDINPQVYSQNLFVNKLSNRHIELLQKYQHRIFKLFCNELDRSLSINQINKLQCCIELNFQCLNHNLLEINSENPSQLQYTANQITTYCLEHGIIWTQQQKQNIFNLYPTFLSQATETLTLTQQDYKANYIIAAYQTAENIALLYIPLHDLQNVIVRSYPIYKSENGVRTNLIFMFKYQMKIEQQQIEQLFRSYPEQKNQKLFEQIIIGKVTSPNYVFDPSLGSISLLLFYYQYMKQYDNRIVYTLTSDLLQIENQLFSVQLLESAQCEYLIVFSYLKNNNDCYASLVLIENGNIKKQQHFLILSGKSKLQESEQNIDQQRIQNLVQDHQNGIYLIHADGLSIAMEYENGDDNLMIFHSLSSKSSEKYKKELDKLQEIIRQENIQMSHSRNNQLESVQQSDQQFYEILRKHREGLENELELSQYNIKNQLTFITNIQNEQDINKFYDQLVQFLHSTPIEQQTAINKFNASVQISQTCLVKNSILKYYIELCQSADNDNILQVLKVCEANKTCVSLTYKILLLLAPQINEYIDMINNNQRDNLYFQLFQFIISYDYQENEYIVQQLLQGVKFNYKLFLTQYKHFQNINSIFNLQVIIRLYIEHVINDTDPQDAKQVQEAYDVLQNLHPNQRLLQKFNVHIIQKQTQFKLFKYYELLLTVPTSYTPKPYQNNILLLLLFVSAHTLEQKVTIYQLLKKHCKMQNQCEKCNKQYQYVCDYCENNMVLSNKLQIVQLLQSMVYNSYYDKQEINNVKYLLQNAFSNDTLEQQVSLFKQKVDYTQYVVDIIIQSMNYELEISNICVNNYSNVNQTTKKCILSYLIEKSLIDKSLDFIYLLDENNEQTNTYVFSQLTTRYYKAANDIRLTPDQLLYILLYFSKHNNLFEKQTEIYNLILYIMYQNADILAFDCNFQQLGLYVLNLIHIQNKSILQQFINKQESLLDDNTYFQIVDMLSSNGKTEYKNEKLSLLQIFCYLVTRQTQFNFMFIQQFLSYTLLAISNHKLSKQMLLSCKLLIQWIMLIFMESDNPYVFKPIQLLTIAINQKNNFIIRIILHRLHLYHLQPNGHIKQDMETILIQCLKIEDPHILYYASYLFRNSSSSISKKIIRKSEESYLQMLKVLQGIEPSYIIQYKENQCIKIVSLPSEIILQQSVYYGISGQLQFQSRDLINKQSSTTDFPIKMQNSLQQIQQTPDIFTCIFQQYNSPVTIESQKIANINNFNDMYTCFLSKYLMFSLFEQQDIISIKMPTKLLEYLLQYSFEETIQRIHICIKCEQEKLTQTKAKTSAKQYNEKASQISFFCNLLSSKIKTQLMSNRQLIGNIVNNFITQQHLLQLILQLTHQSLIHPYDSVFYAMYFLCLSKVAGSQCVQLLLVCKRRFQIINMFKRALEEIKSVIKILNKVDLSSFFNIQHLFRVLCDDKVSFQTLLKNIAAVLLTSNSEEQNTLFNKYYQYITCFLPFEIYDDCLQWFSDVISEYEQLAQFQQQIVSIYSNSKKFKQEIILQLAQDICKQK